MRFFDLLVLLLGGSYSIRRHLLAAACAVSGWFILLDSQARDILLGLLIGADVEAAGAAFRI